MPGLVRPLERLSPRAARGFGPKAKNLALLARAGLPVPLTAGLSASVCRRFLRRTLPGSDWMRTLLSEATEPSEERLRAIRARIEAASLPVALRHDIRMFLDEARLRGVRRFAVRSSALHEDAAVASAAGLHSTFLGLTTDEEVFRAVLAVWSSLYQRKVIRYLSRLGQEQEPAVGVLFQEFIPADAAGVLFTANPITGDAGELMLNAHYGLGAPVTDGEVTPDVVRISRSPVAVRDQVLGTKREALRPGGPEGLRTEPVPEDLRARPTLDERQIQELVALALRAETMVGGPQDIEWALHRGRFVLLQCRPITVVSSRDWGSPVRSTRDRSRVVWSNVNVGESLPGVVSPLTWSVLSRFADTGFRQAFSAMGCRMPEGAELFGNFRGRIYLNLTELLEIVSQVPGVGPELVFSLGGGHEARLLSDQGAPEVSRTAFYLRLPLTVARFVEESVGFGARLARHEQEFALERRRLVSLDLRLLSQEALDRALWDAERLLTRTGGVMLSAYGRLLVGLALLRLVLRAAGAKDHVALEQSLLGGGSAMEASAPAFALARVVTRVQGDGPALSYLRGTAADRFVWADFPAGDGRAAVEEFLAEHGFRGPREAELMAPRWREQPELVLRALQRHLEGGRVSVPPPEGDLFRARRARAERALEGSVALPLRPVVRQLVQWITSLLSIRERLRAQATETLSVFRGVALDASRRLAFADPGYGEDAGFFLTVDELHAVLRGRARHLSDLVERRRRHHARDLSLADPPSTFVGSPPAEEHPAEAEEVIRGLAACAGYVEGPARVALSYADAESVRAEEILVVPHADIGWSLLFTVARGVVTELGGPLSHAAIMLREYGVPAVVNAAGATRSVRTGDWISVDGDRGVVRVLRRAEGGAADAP